MKKRVSSIALRKRLYKVASTQLGFFTAKQASDCGYETSAHAYHVKSGNWEHAWKGQARGVYRLKEFPIDLRNEDLAIWALWASTPGGEQVGVYCYQGAFQIFGVSDASAHKVQLAFPTSYRLTKKIPSFVRVFKKDYKPEEIVTKFGCVKVTSILRTALDLYQDHMEDLNLIHQGLYEGFERKLFTVKELSAKHWTAEERKILKELWQANRKAARRPDRDLYRLNWK